VYKVQFGVGPPIMWIDKLTSFPSHSFETHQGWKLRLLCRRFPLQRESPRYAQVLHYWQKRRQFFECLSTVDPSCVLANDLPKLDESRCLPSRLFYGDESNE